MSFLILGLGIFFGLHSTSIVNRAWRNQKVAALGEGAWKGIYSLLSLIGFALICYGFGLAREAPIILYTPPAWTKHLAFTLLLPVFPLALAVYLPGRLKAFAKNNPLLLATKFWATAHLLVNGGLHDVLLFGSFLLWAAVDRMSMMRRDTAPVTLALNAARNDAIAIVAGLLIYGIFMLWLHRILIGVSPL